MSDIQLPDYPWEHPHESDYEEARAMSDNATLVALRKEGWAVAVHNDYWLAGERKTFWLLTSRNGRWIKGEADTDEAALGECRKQADAWRDIHQEATSRIAELEAERDKAREAGHEEVLAFIRNGRFLSDSAPTARFAREIEAGWKSWGKAQAEKNRANHGPRVADASFSQEAPVGSRGEEPSALPSPTEGDGP